MTGLKPMNLAVRIAGCVFSAAACAVVAGFAWPQARDAVAVLIAQDDPAALSEAQLRTTARPKPADIEREIDAALASGDTGLAQSFVDLASALDIPLSSAAIASVATAVATSRTAAHLV